MAVYWLSTFWFLNRYCGMTGDGGGPMSSFWWSFDSRSGAPLPSNAEFEGNRMVRLVMFLPYWIGAGILSIAGMLIVRRVVSSASALSRFSAARSAGRGYLAACVGIAALSDTGVYLRLWFGPLIFADPFQILTVLVPLLASCSLMTAAIAAILWRAGDRHASPQQWAASSS